MHWSVSSVHTLSTICLLVIRLLLLALFRDVVCLTLIGAIVVVLVDFNRISKIVLLVDYDFVIVFCVPWICHSGQSLLIDNLVVNDLGLLIIVLLWMITGGIQDTLLGLQEVLVICLRRMISRVVMWLFVGGLASSPNFADLSRDALGTVIHGHVMNKILNFLLIVCVRECWIDQIFAEGLNIFVSADRARVLSFGNALTWSHALNRCILGGASLCSSQRAPLAEILSWSCFHINSTSLLNIPPILLVSQFLISLLLASWVIEYTAGESAVLDNDGHLLRPRLLHATKSPGLISDSQRWICFCHFLRHTDDVRRLSSFVRQNSGLIWLGVLGGILGEAHTRMGISNLVAFIDEGIRISKHVARKWMLYTWHLCLWFDLVSSGEATSL